MRKGKRAYACSETKDVVDEENRTRNVKLSLDEPWRPEETEDEKNGGKGVLSPTNGLKKGKTSN